MTSKAYLDQAIGADNTWLPGDSPVSVDLYGRTWNVTGDDNVTQLNRYAAGALSNPAEAYQGNLGDGNDGSVPNGDIVVGSGSQADIENMLSAWGITNIADARQASQGYDVGDAGRVEGTPFDYQAALKATGVDPSKEIYRAKFSADEMLGKDKSRMFMDVGYQPDEQGNLQVLGKPGMNYVKTQGAENVSGLAALLAAYTLGGSLAATSAGGTGSAMATAAAEANAANAAQGFGNLGMSGVAPAASMGEQAIAAYQAAQPYLKAINTLGSVASGNPMGAVMGYVPGVDIGLGEIGNAAANGAIRAGLSGGNPIMGAMTSAAGNMIPAEFKQYIPMANALVSASNGKLTLQQALSLVASKMG